MRVLVTGGAGFIGSHVVAALRADGARRGGLDVLHPAAHRHRPMPDGGAAAATSATRDVGRRGAARRRRGGAPGRDGRHGRRPRRPARVRRPATTSAPRCCSPAWPGRGAPAGAGQLDGGLRRGRLPLRRRTARSAPAPARRADLRAGPLRARAARAAASRCAPGARRRGRAAATRAASTPRPRWRRSTSPRRGRASRRAPCVALRYHNVYGPGMPRDTPYAGVAAIFRSASSAARRRGSSRTAASAATSSTSPTSPAANVAALDRWPTPDRGCRRVQHRLRRAAHRRRHGRRAGRRLRRPAARW